MAVRKGNRAKTLLDNKIFIIRFIIEWANTLLKVFI